MAYFNLINLTFPSFLRYSKIMIEITSIFPRAFSEVFQEMGLEAALNSNSSGFNIELVSTIGLTGDIQGFLLLSSTLKSAKELVKTVSKVMGIENIEEDFGEYHQATFGELSNMISGRATILLSEMKIDSNITPPTVYTGNAIRHDMANFRKVQKNYFDFPFGSFELVTAIKNLKK